MNVGRLIRRRRPRSRPPARLARVASIWLAGLLLASCTVSDDGERDVATVPGDADGYRGTLVDPPLKVASVTLRDTNGAAVRLDLLTMAEESITAIFFGFTNCNDVCPTTMADLAAARRALPAGMAQRTQLVFITVDPTRDTPAVLRTWLDRFDPDIAGLRGPLREVHRAERSLYASESGRSAVQSSPSETVPHGEHGKQTPAPGRDGPGYEVDHTSIVYLFGPDEETVIYTGDATVGDYAADFVKLLR